MGDCLHGNEFGVTEGCTRDNWAAEYAKKLFDVEASARKNADDDLQGQKADKTELTDVIRQEVSDRNLAIGEAITKEAGWRDDAIDIAISNARSDWGNDIGKAAEEAQKERDRIENDVVARLADRVATAETTINKKQNASFNYSGYTSLEEIASDVVTIYGATWGDNNEFAGLGEVAQQVSRNTAGIQDFNQRITAVNIRLSEEEGARSTAVTALSERISKQETYSTTPARVGWWIDGAPIWRVAISFELDNADIADVNSSGVFGIALPVANINEVILVNERICQGFENMNIVDDIRCTYDGGTSWQIGSQSALTNGGANHIHGWIEFVASESNLK